MYDELKTKCEAFKEEIMAVLPDLDPNDVRDNSLYKTIHRTANGIDSIVNTINAYYSKN